MRSITFYDGSKKRFQEAMNIIADMEKTNPDAAKEMLASLGSSALQLLRILFNRDIPEKGYIEEGTYNLAISGDFVTGSFGFAFSLDNQPGLNGGLILHGFEETFSVELGGRNIPHWSLHT